MPRSRAPLQGPRRGGPRGFRARAVERRTRRSVAHARTGRRQAGVRGAPSPAWFVPVGAGAHRVRRRPVRHRPSVTLAGRGVHDRGRQPIAWADPGPAQDTPTPCTAPTTCACTSSSRYSAGRRPRSGCRQRSPPRWRPASSPLSECGSRHLRHAVAACIRPARRPALRGAPSVTRYAQEARSYATVSALVVIATYLLVRALEDRRRRWWVGYGAAIALARLFNLLRC